jgi:hypothetical protein
VVGVVGVDAHQRSLRGREVPDDLPRRREPSGAPPASCGGADGRSDRWTRSRWWVAASRG